MGTTRYDPLDRASLQLWMEGRNDDNHLQLERLLRNLPLAVEQELTPRQRQILRMRYSSGMRNVEVAAGAGGEQIDRHAHAQPRRRASFPHASLQSLNFFRKFYKNP